MNKRIIFVILIVIILIAIVILFRFNKKDTKQKSISDIVYNEVEETYYIYDENNNVIHSSKEEADMKLYQDNPDYNPMIF